jgi:hypothetical protein
VSTDEDPVAWLRRTAGAELAAARLVIAPCDGECGRPCDFHPAADAEWLEPFSGTLQVRSDGTGADIWHGVWAMGDSRVTRFIAANDPRSVIARCEAELAILDLHDEWMPFANVEEDASGVEAIRRVVRLLASGYRHRKGYRETEWKP